MPAPAPPVVARPAAVKAMVFPADEKAAEDEIKVPLPPPVADVPVAPTASQGLASAWANSAKGPARSAFVGVYLPAYEELESCCLSLSSFVDAPRFFTARLGTVGPDGQISHQDSVKITGEWAAGEDLEWLIRNVPLRQMASRSPTGLVACRVKLWFQGRLCRHWMGRTPPAALPAPPHVVRLGGAEIILACCRGPPAEAAAKRGARILDFATLAGAVGVTSTSVPMPPPWRAQQQGPNVESMGQEILRVSGERQWGVAAALLHQLMHSPAETRRAVLSEVTSTRHTALRLCVDGQHRDSAPPIQALERSTLTVILGNRRPYWWCLRISKICHHTLSFLGQVWIGMPRHRGFSHSPFMSGRPWTAPAGSMQWEEVRWSEPENCCGELEVCAAADPPGEPPPQFGRLRIGADTELLLRAVPPGESGVFGAVTLRNPLGVPLVVAHGRIAGSHASGLFDHRACARLAAEKEGCGPREAAALAVACGADPRALADDGLSPYTAALLGEDPCGLLAGLDMSLRLRILRGDPAAWAEASRGRAGAGHADMIAAPLTRGLAVPDELAQGLLEYCFKADLPLVAVRALSRVDGQRFLLPALERAGDMQWLRAVDRILQQTRTSTPSWCSGETLAYAVAQVREGRQQFRLLLKDLLLRIRKGHDFYSHPANLPSTGGAECPICFEPLCRGIPKVFVDDDGRAICPHFLCPSCAHNYAATASSTGSWLRCPECRRSAPKVEALPSLTRDPLEWFDFLANTEGTMARSTLVRAVSAMLPVDTDILASMVESGALVGGQPIGQEITAAEFLAGGLYAWVWRHEEEYQRCSALGNAPDLCERQDWFKHWNISGTGSLTRGELLRAVLNTLEVSSLEPQKVVDVRERTDRLWDAAVTERRKRGGQPSSGPATFAEFTEVGGLADQLEETFGVDLSKGGGRREQVEVGGPAVLALSRSPFPRRKRGEPAPASEWTSAASSVSTPRPKVAARPPPPSSAAAAAAAGVLGLLELPSQDAPAGLGVPGDTAAQEVSAPALPTPASLGCLTMPHGNLDAMAALEGLERDLALSQSTVISI